MNLGYFLAGCFTGVALATGDVVIESALLLLVGVTVVCAGVGIWRAWMFGEW